MKKTQLTLFISALVLAALACSATSPLQEVLGTVQKPQIEASDPVVTLEPGSNTVLVSSDLISQQDALISLYESVSPGVVSIFVVTEQGSGQGSGFVIDMLGHIVTNYHVVQGATYMEVSFPSGQKATAELVGVDSDSDLAIIQVDTAGIDLVALTLGDSDELLVGQMVIAIGNPFGLSGSMSSGIVSSVGRSLDSLNQSPSGQFFSAGDLIQTDAAINPGNSGGPLLNINGEVIGINRAIRTFNFNDQGDTLNSGIGFAVSVNILKRVAPSLISSGHYDYPYLGLSSISNLTLADAEQLGLDRTNGVFISEITRDGPADQAGLLVGDMILSVNGREVADFNAMISYLFVHTSPGEHINFVLLREGAELNVELTLGARP